MPEDIPPRNVPAPAAVPATLGQSAAAKRARPSSTNPIKQESTDVFDFDLFEDPPTPTRTGETWDGDLGELFPDDPIYVLSSDDEELDGHALLESDDEDEPSRPDTANEITPAPIVNDNGLIRVGPQPFKERPFVRTAPRKTAEHRARLQIRKLIRMVDWRILEEGDAAELEESITPALHTRLIPCSDDRVRMVCDYTGLDMSWAPGPRRHSIEAIHPFAIVDGKIRYHAAANVCSVLVALNFLKKRHPILILPLLSHWLNTHDDPDFQSRKASWSWTYNALLNTGIMNKIFHCTAKRTTQVQQWQQWDQDKQLAVLDHFRTGTFGAAIRDELVGWTPRQLFTGSETGWGGSAATAGTGIDWRVVHRQLERIGGEYGLTSQEFRYHCTIPGPGGGWVFYPYHILSRPLAEEMLWGWSTLWGMATAMLHRMRSNCNRHAEAAGLGESQMDPLKLVYWWAHHLCQKIQRVKEQRPVATAEEVAFHTLDRWGFPVVPWTGNILKASLCKLQDHGIPMRFGLVWPEGEDFDPVEHFDFARCTVTIDAQATNLAMFNFPVSAWEGIREALSSVPLSHPFWRVEPELGLATWGPHSDSQPTAQPPAREFDIPLAPIKPWLAAGEPLHDIQCTDCPGVVRFQTPGLLVRHYQLQHRRLSGTPGPITKDQSVQGQDAVDRFFWEDRGPRFPCTEPECDQTFIDAHGRDTHVSDVHQGIKYPCKVPGCPAILSSRGALSLHIKSLHTVRIRVPCTESGCDETFVNERGRDLHVETVHLGKRFACQECEATYASPSGLSEHMRYTHRGEPLALPCTYPGCSATFASAQNLSVHIDNIHLKIRWPCEWPGCGKTLASKAGAAKHYKSQHQHDGSRLPCTVAGCDDTFVSLTTLAVHVAHVHNGTPHPCEEPGCNAVLSSSQSLKQHVNRMHKSGPKKPSRQRQGQANRKYKDRNDSDAELGERGS